MIRKGVKAGKRIFHKGTVRCQSCGEPIPSSEQDCPSCNANRKVGYAVSEIAIGEQTQDPADIAKIERGAHPCGHCGKLTWYYDATERGYICEKGCGANTGEDSKVTNYVLAGGKPEVDRPVKLNKRYLPSAPDLSMPLWQKLAIGGAGLGVLVFVIWFFISLMTTREVQGVVSDVYWERHAHQEEYQLLTGEGWDLPADATPVGDPQSRFHHDQENIIDYTYLEYTVTSTPEVIDYEYDTVMIETPGAIFTSEPYECGDPTPEPGGYVSYDECVDEYQEESTYGEGLSDPTPVYANPVIIQMTSEPTPVYGPPTPIYKDYWVYTYWQWVKLFDLGTNSGHNDDPQWPNGQVDSTHRAVNDSQYYRVEITFKNGYIEIIEGSDPSVLEKYFVGIGIKGFFNIFGGLNHHEP